MEFHVRSSADRTRIPVNSYSHDRGCEDTVPKEEYGTSRDMAEGAALSAESAGTAGLHGI